MKFISLVFALIQISFVEPRYVLVPPCQCMVNSITPAARVHLVDTCAKPTLSIPHDRCSHAYRFNAIPELHTYRELHSKAHPQHGPQFHDERISYQRDYYPGHYEEDLEIFYEDEGHEVRHRRSVLSEDERHRIIDEGDFRKYFEDWEGEVSEGVEEEDESTDELNSGVASSNEGGEAVSESDWAQKGDLELANVVTEDVVKSIEKDKEVGNKQKQTPEINGQASNETNSKDGENSVISKKTKRSINDQQFRYQYRPLNQGYCSAVDRYSKNGNHLHQNVHADDCTINKNLFFGCDMEDDKMKDTQRKARKAPKTLAQKINELKLKNEKLKNESKLSKSKTKKVNKLENSLKKEKSLRNKRKEEEGRLEREFEATACPCGSYDRNGACTCQLQPYYNPVAPTPMYFDNPMAYPVRRVYRQYTPHMHQQPIHAYYRH
ncbi:hypothetical protein LSTR_LSTR004217 [Laodelphax striatellus]|uniref:Uncharacterized protein n=1 Tax=Laodelphax striatellus TaxID=195883 RepID=A0A482X9Q9_LAOST|nr:hypothetical protein LSTR_LSTR004217 [Laodelphax striatellus]